MGFMGKQRRDAPDAPGAAASWSIEGTLEFIEIGSGEEFVADGQTVPVEVHSDGAGGAADAGAVGASRVTHLAPRAC